MYVANDQVEITLFTVGFVSESRARYLQDGVEKVQYLTYFELETLSQQPYILVYFGGISGRYSIYFENKYLFK